MKNKIRIDMEALISLTAQLKKLSDSLDDCARGVNHIQLNEGTGANVEISASSRLKSTGTQLSAGNTKQLLMAVQKALRQMSDHTECFSHTVSKVKQEYERCEHGLMNVINGKEVGEGLVQNQNTATGGFRNNGSDDVGAFEGDARLVAQAGDLAMYTGANGEVWLSTQENARQGGKIGMMLPNGSMMLIGGMLAETLAGISAAANQPGVLASFVSQSAMDALGGRFSAVNMKAKAGASSSIYHAATTGQNDRCGFTAAALAQTVSSQYEAIDGIFVNSAAYSG